MSERPTWWRPVATVAAFAVLPLAVFLSDNRNEVDLEGTLLLFPLAFFLIGLAVVGIAGRRRGRRTAERVAVAYAAGLYVAFQFQHVRDAFGIPDGRWGRDEAAWLLACVIAVGLAWWLSRFSPAWNWALAVGVALTAINLFHFATYDDAGGAQARSSVAPFPAAARHAGKGGPDVYFFVLDGYARADQIKKYVGYDNRPFLAALRRRGFTVADEARAAYPSTEGSVPSTLSLDYGLPGGRLSKYLMDVTLRGTNVAEASLRRLGYDYVHATDYSTDGCTGREDLCVSPKGGKRGVIGTPERAFLEATPLAPALPSALKEVGSKTGVLNPDAVVDEVEARRGRRPVFVYSHLMTPHPPYRFNRDCSVRSAFDGHLDDWGDAGGIDGRRYAETIACTNRSVLRAVDHILRDHPDALIFFQGDHGSSFGLNWSRPVSSWPDADLRQRYPMLSVAHFPERCHERAPVVPTNTFREVLSCITGERVPLLPERHFAIGYGDNDKAVPIPTARLR